MSKTLELEAAPVSSSGQDGEKSSVTWTWRQALIGAGVLTAWRIASYFGGETINALPDFAWAAAGLLLPLAWMLFYPLFAASENDAVVSVAPAEGSSVARELGWGVLAGIAAVVGLYGVSALSFWLTGEALGSSSDAAMGNGFRATLLLLVAFTLTPVAEEIFFRGLLLDAGRRQFGWSTALLAQALFFALMHDGSWIQTVLRFVLGLGLGGLALGRRSLIANIVMHAVVNLVWSVAAALMMLMMAHSPFLGIAGESAPEGFRVVAVVPGSPAEQAGVQVGDMLLSLDSTPIHSKEEFQKIVRGKKAGQTVELQLNRDAKPLQLKATLFKRKEVQP